jgi:dihydroorotase
MIASTRRRFLANSGSLLALGAAVPRGSALAAMGPNDKFDLVIKGGEVLDPSQNLRAKRDIGIRWGMIEAVEPDIPADRALGVLSASGKLVCPGLVDLHAHVYPYGSAMGIPADELLTFQGTTTMVSAGDAGANNFAGFRRFIVGQTRTRLYAFVHIANIGLTPFPLPELYNIDYAVVDACAKTIAENSDIAIGVKVRNVGKRHRQQRSRAAATLDPSGPAGGRRRPGDVPYRRGRDGQADVGHSRSAAARRYPDPCLFRRPQQCRRLHQYRAGLPAATAAKQRGVVFDVGHGGGSFDYTVADVAIQAGAIPDTISSDIHVFSGNTPGLPYLTRVMSKFLNMGFTLEQVVAMATINPARVINRLPKLGTLAVGAPGDVSVLELVEGPVEFVDTRNNKRLGKVQLQPANVVIAGVPFGRPYQIPFAVR